MCVARVGNIVGIVNRNSPIAKKGFSRKNQFKHNNIICKKYAPLLKPSTYLDQKHLLNWISRVFVAQTHQSTSNNLFKIDLLIFIHLNLFFSTDPPEPHHRFPPPIHVTQPTSIIVLIYPFDSNSLASLNKHLSPHTRNTHTHTLDQHSWCDCCGHAFVFGLDVYHYHHHHYHHHRSNPERLPIPNRKWRLFGGVEVQLHRQDSRAG